MYTFPPLSHFYYCQVRNKNLPIPLPSPLYKLPIQPVASQPASQPGNKSYCIAFGICIWHSQLCFCISVTHVRHCMSHVRC